MSRRLTFAVVALCAVALLTATRAQEEPKSATQIEFEAAVNLYEEGKLPEALAAFDKFSKERSLSLLAPSAIYFQGWCLIALNRTKEAVPLFQKLVTTFPHHPVAAEAMLKLAESHRELKEMDKALATYREFQTKFAKSDFLPQAMLGEAWVLFKSGQNKEAKNLAGRVLREHADNASAKLDSLFLLGQVFSDEQNFEEARKVYDELKRMRNNDRISLALFNAAESLYNNGEKLLKGGQPAAGQKAYEDAIQYYERVMSRDSLLADLARQVRGLRDQMPRASRDQRELIQQQIAQLQGLASGISKQMDLRPLALFRVANAYQSLDKPEEASLVYRHFLRLYKDTDKNLASQAQFGLIQTLNLRGQPDKANEETRRFEQDYPEMKDKNLLELAKFMKGDAQFKTGQHKEALASFQDFLATSKNAELNETAEFYIAACHYSLKELEQARDAFGKFIQKFPQSKLKADATFRLGRTYFELAAPERAPDKATRQQNLNEAAKYYEQARAGDAKPELASEVTFLLGYLYATLGEYDKANYGKAATTFAEFVQKWPTDPLAPESNYQLARNLYASGKLDEAIAAYQQLIEKYPDDKLAPWAAFEIALTHGAAKRPDEMVTALKAFAAKHPTHEKAAEALFTVGKNLEGRGQTKEAIAAYNNLIEFAANSPEKTDAVLNPATQAQLQIAILLAKNQQVKEAVAACEQFLAKFSDSDIACRTMIAQIVAMCRAAKLYEDGIASLTKLRIQYSQNAGVRLAATTGLVELHTAKGDLQGAYGEALKLHLDPDRNELPASGFITVGNTFLKTAHPDQARDAFQQMLAKYAEDARSAPVALVGLGNAFLNLKQLDEAEKNFRQTISEHEQAKHPAVLDARLGLGKVLEAREQLDAAQLEYKIACTAKGETGMEAYVRLGKIALIKNDPKPALPLLGRAFMAGGLIGEEAAFLTAKCHKALCMRGETGACEMARATLKSYVARYPTGRFIKEAQDELNALPPPAAPKP